MNGPNDRRNNEDVERATPDGAGESAEDQRGDAERIEAESTLSWREREALLPDSYAGEAAADSGLVPRSDAGDVERGTDDTDTGADTPEGPIVRE